MGKIEIDAAEFLSCFFDPADVVHLRVLDDKKRGVFNGQMLKKDMGKINEIMGLLREHNELGRGVFFVVNSGGNNDSDITRINAQFFECDNLDFSEQWARINAFPLKPSLVVKTKKSLHTYFLISNGKVSDFRRIQKKFVKHFDADPQLANESRCMRLPGFNHCKGEPLMVEVVRFNPELRYTQSELEEHLPTLGDEPQAGSNEIKQQRESRGLELLPLQCAFIKHCRDNAATLSEHDWYAMITNLAAFEGGEKPIHEYSAAYPSYNKEETDKKIKHYLKSDTSPITCAVICEKGF